MEKSEKPLKLRGKKSRSKDKRDDVECTCIVHQPHYRVYSKPTFISEISFKTIQESARIRQCQENPSDREDEICSNLPNEFHPFQYGYHRQCYQRFTNVSRLVRRRKASSDTLPEPSFEKRRRITETSSITKRF